MAETTQVREGQVSEASLAELVRQLSEQTSRLARQEVELARAELGDTVEALAHKADVKAQATRKLDQTKAQATQQLERTKASVSENPLPFATAGALVACFLAWRLIRG